MTALKSQKIRHRTMLDDIRTIERGATVKQVERLVKKTGMTQKRFIRIVGLSPTTLAERKKKGRFNPVESERVLRIENVYKLATEVFDNNKKAASEWLMAPHPEFESRAPIDMLTTDIGKEAVITMLHRIDHGMF